MKMKRKRKRVGGLIFKENGQEYEYESQKSCFPLLLEKSSDKWVWLSRIRRTIDDFLDTTITNRSSYEEGLLFPCDSSN